MTLVFRQTLLEQCISMVDRKVEDIRESIKHAEDSLFNETKSSAGDKYETSREMIQQDLDRLQRQMLEANKDRALLSNIQTPNGSVGNVVLGSLVQTESAIYFIAVGLGQVICNGTKVYVISAQSPIGRLLLGKQEGESLDFNGKQQTIATIL